MTKTIITDRDLENPQRFVGEGLGAPEAKINSPRIKVYVPTNSGLSFVAEQGKQWLANPRNLGSFTDPEFGLRSVPERGEAIPNLIVEQESAEQPVFGITGEDLLAEFDTGYVKADGTYYSPKEGLWVPLVTKLNLADQGPYEGTVFGLPALCLLGKGGLDPKQFTEFFSYRQDREDPAEIVGRVPDLNGKRIMVPKRYGSLIREKLYLPGDGAPDWVVRDRSVEVTAAADESIDFAVDILLSGRTLVEETNLGIYAMLFASDGVVMGNKAARELRRSYRSKVAYDLLREPKGTTSPFLRPSPEELVEADLSISSGK